MTNAEPNNPGSLFCIFNCMKIFLLFLTMCVAFANAQGFKPIKKLENIPEDKIQRTIDVSRDSLRKEFWLEVEKNEIVKICIDNQVHAWETSLNSKILNDSCLIFQAPMLTGTSKIDIYSSKYNSQHTINLAIDMKYLDFKNEEVLLGFNVYTTKSELKDRNLINNEDPERLVSVTGDYLVDKYPVTNCDFTQLMWDSIPEDSSLYIQGSKKEQRISWRNRKKTSKRYENCVTHDSAASTVFLYQAMKYANTRSINEGLKPYYLFSQTNIENEQITPDGYIIGLCTFTTHKAINTHVSIDASSDGYRLPYYDEWMMFARGRDKKRAPWGDTSATFEKALKYARFNSERPGNHIRLYYTEPVGQLQPNGYGLYDMFGLVREHVLLKKSLFRLNGAHPYCLKGGSYRVSLKDEPSNPFICPNWNKFNYGTYFPGFRCLMAGFRLIRNIGNNAKWEERVF